MEITDVTSVKFGPYGRCIYCGSSVYSEVDPSQLLGGEHPIPFCLAMDMELLQASCQECEKRIGPIDQYAGRQVFRQLRETRRMRSRNSKPSRNKKKKVAPLSLWFEFEDKCEEFVMPAHSLPAAIILPILQPPGMLTAKPLLDNWPALGFHYVVDKFDHEKISKAIGRRDWQRVHYRTPHNISLFCRLLAKIAHGFAVAKYGPDGFEAFLPPFILGNDKGPRILHLVGGQLDVPEPSDVHSQELHSVVFETWESPGLRTLVCARIRLFSNSKTPVYRVISGALTAG